MRISQSAKKNYEIALEQKQQQRLQKQQQKVDDTLDWNA